MKDKRSEVYSEPSQTSKMEIFAKIVNSQKSWTIFTESSILDVQLGSEYVSASSFSGTFYICLGKKD